MTQPTASKKSDFQELTPLGSGWLGARLAMGHASRVSRYCGLEEANEPEIAALLGELEEMAKCMT